MHRLLIYYRFQYYRGFTLSRNSFEARRVVLAILLKTKARYLQNQINKKSKHLNRTVNLQAFEKPP